ncbi:MAG: hypothetical protein GY820_13115, partial [Gammaproteobacteria bacterium]|nr:hypothetical protein [Gammaproteobacteria bacterium]
LRVLLKRRKLSKIFVIGDLNLHGVSWDSLRSSLPIEQLFVDSFIDLGLAQCVTDPTHQKGNTLDILLTNSEASIDDLKVLDHDSICKSDHFPINFKIKVKICKKKPVKRICYNFKTANWDGLNHDLCHVDWDALLSCTEPEIGWRKFKGKLSEITNKHIKKVCVKSDGQDPWFDSECYDAYRNKMRLHKTRSRSDNDNLKFSIARKTFNNLVAQKMRDTLNEDDDHALITKKFWSFVKQKSGSSRIPEFVSYRDV